MLDQAEVSRGVPARTVAPKDHLVLFYEQPTALVESIASFAAEGLAAGDAVLLVATPDHIASVRTRLGDAGAGMQTLDAGETLAQFCEQGVIDHTEFMKVIGGLVRDAAGDGRPVRVFGEMVALLWDDGHVPAAVELEALWCNLGHTEPFTLMCAYPAELLLDLRAAEPVIDVCRLHSGAEVRSHAGTGSYLHAFPASLPAVADARRFVTDCLRHAGPELLYDARLLASELSSNAVQHARTAFLVEVALLDEAIRIAVRDADPELPELKPITLEGDAGRGIALVAALSARWGVESHPEGKTVWAELPAGPARR